jgi:hypothetical protein
MVMPQSEELIQRAGDPDMAKILVHVPGIALVVLGFALAFWAIYWDYRRQALEFEERRLMIERGLIPPPYVHKRTPVFSHRLNLSMGMLLTFLGLGLGLAALTTNAPGGTGGREVDWNLFGGALIVGVLGIGQITYYYLAKRQKGADKSQPARGKERR